MKGKVIIMFDNNENLSEEEEKAEKLQNAYMTAGIILCGTCALYMGIHCVKAIAGTENNNTNSAFKVNGGIN
jgi:hypothetical protein